MILIEVRDMCFSFPGREKPLLKGINLSVSKGEVLAVVGLSGSGKSTLCYCMSGIIPLIKKGTLEGEVLIKDVPASKMTIPQISKSLGIVFQNPDNQLFSPTVEDEIAFGPENFALPREEIAERIKRVLEMTGIEKHRYKNPRQLSGGEKQLVALSAVLSLDPDILIFDEAMSQLDTEGKARIKELILRLRKEGKTIVMVEHDPDNLHVADRIKLLHDGQLTDFNENWPEGF